MKKWLITFFMLSVFCYPQTLVNVYNFPYYGPYNYFWGVTHIGDVLWLATDYDSSPTYPYAKLYKVTSQGIITDSVDTPFKFNHGLAWDGSNFWVAEDYRSNGARVFKITTSGARLDSITLPSLIGGTTGGVGGIEISGNSLWFTVYYPDFTSYPYAYAYKMDLTTRQVTDTIPLRGKQVQGITVKGDTVFYVSDNFQGDVERIYAYRKAVNDTIFSFPLPDPDGDNNPKGLHWDGNNLWLVADRVGSTAYAYRALYKYSLGGGGTPVIQTTSSLGFGDVTIGLPQNQMLFINNSGTGDLRIDSLKITNPVFSVSPLNTPHILPPGQGKTYTVTFAPINTDIQVASLMVYSNDVNTPVKTISLSGHGVYGLPYISFSSEQLNFGSKRKNSTSSMSLTISNLGGGQLRIDSIKTGTGDFYLYRQSFPIIIDSTKNKTTKLWFHPQNYNAYSDTLKVYSNGSNGAIKKILALGSGSSFDTTLGSVLWQGYVPDNPTISLQDLSAKNIKKASDLNGDGVNDLLVATDNYQVVAFNGNSSGSADIIWTYLIENNGSHMGGVDRLQCLQQIPDINNDGVKDVIIGTSGGSESVIALSGLNGSRIWQFGDTIASDQGDIYGLDVKRDWSGDGIPDVLAAASGNEYTGNGRFSVYCLNILNGQILWQINEASQYKLKYGIASTDDGGAYGSRPANVTAGTVTGFNKSGQVNWNFATPSAPWAVEEIPNVGGNPGSDIIAGDVSGHVFCLDGKNGAQLWTQTLGNVFIEDLIIIDDVNGSGKKDILVSSLASPLYVLEGGSGQIIWQANTGGTILGAGPIGDITGDGIPEVAAGNLVNYLRLYNGASGTEIFNWFNGAGSDYPVESAWGLGDIDGNGTPEFAAGTRDGKVAAFYGGHSGASSPKLTVISPNGGELLLVNNQYSITWSSISVENVKLEYTTNNGQSWLPIAASIPAVPSSYSWSIPNTLTSEGKVRVTDLNNSAVFDISDNSFIIANNGTAININMKTGWNLVSVPFQAANMSLSALFPQANSSAFYYNNGYIATDTLSLDKGYWVRYPQNASVIMTGSVPGYITIPVAAGWNMIGLHNLPIPVSGITTSPSGILNSSFFGFDNGYFIAQTLNAGNGYWIRASQPGTINLNVSSSRSKNTFIAAEIKKEWGSLRIMDQTGRAANLYFSDKVDLQSGLYDLPPAGPSELFDARFRTDRFVDNLSSVSEIVISGASYPMTISNQGQEMVISDKATGGRLLKAALKTGQSLSVTDPSINSILVEKNVLPADYHLFQNHPNPFNPITRINYELPRSGRVRLVVYDMLGKEISLLLDKQMEAGRYSTDFDASKLASGIFIYELTCNNFRASRKMVVIK